MQRAWELADNQRVKSHSLGSALFGVAALIVFMTALVAAWATRNYWETTPLVATVSAVGVLTALSRYLRNRDTALALAYGGAAAMTTLISTLPILLARWTS